MEQPHSPLSRWLICAPLLLSAPLSLAATEPSGQYIAPMLSYIQADDGRSADNGFGIQVALGQQFSERWNLELNLNFDILSFENGNGEYKQAGLQLDALYFFKRGELSIYGLVGVGMLGTTIPGDTENNPSANIGLGLMHPINDSVQLRGEVRYRADSEDRIAGESRFDDLLVNVGVMIPFGEKPKPTPKPAPKPEPAPVVLLDSDDDGVTDNSDHCPGTIQGRSVDANGCEMDSDHDSIVDALDRCPDTPADHSVDQHGCEKDGDLDGIVDSLDQCPDTAPNRTVNPQGCENDSDNDGIVDALDQCNNTAEGIAVDAQGCIADRDGDGILNNVDQCPDSAVDAKIDETGCKLAEIIVLKGVNFKTGSAQLTSNSDVELNQIIETMINYPTLIIKVSGYSDNRGPESFNRHLSQQRAQAVVQYLTDRSISEERLQAHGYGSANPIADNNTASGRKENRRVELHILKR